MSKSSKRKNGMERALDALGKTENLVDVQDSDLIKESLIKGNLNNTIKNSEVIEMNNVIEGREMFVSKIEEGVTSLETVEDVLRDNRIEDDKVVDTTLEGAVKLHKELKIALEQMYVVLDDESVKEDVDNEYLEHLHNEIIMCEEHLISAQIKIDKLSGIYAEQERLKALYNREDVKIIHNGIKNALKEGAKIPSKGITGKQYKGMLHMYKMLTGFDMEDGQANYLKKINDTQARYVSHTLNVVFKQRTITKRELERTSKASN